MPKPVVAAVNGVAAGRRGEPGVRLRPPDPGRHAPGFNLAFAGIALSCDTGVVLDAAAAGRPGQGARAALLPAHHPGRGGARARAGHHGGAGRRARRARSATLARTARRRPDGRVRRDPPVGGATPPATTSRTSLAFEAEMMTLTGATEDHRQRRRRVRGQGEAGLRGPLAPAARRPRPGRACLRSPRSISRSTTGRTDAPAGSADHGRAGQRPPSRPRRSVLAPSPRATTRELALALDHRAEVQHLAAAAAVRGALPGGDRHRVPEADAARRPVQARNRPPRPAASSSLSTRVSGIHSPWRGQSVT